MLLSLFKNSIVKLYFTSCEKIDSKVFSSGKAIIFDIKKDLSPATVQKIYDIIESSKGDKPVFMEIKDGQHKFIYKFKSNTSFKTKNVIEKIIEMETKDV